MKIQQENTFRPITLTLETEDEVRALRWILGERTLNDYAQAIGTRDADRVERVASEFGRLYDDVLPDTWNKK